LISSLIIDHPAKNKNTKMIFSIQGFFGNFGKNSSKIKTIRLRISDVGLKTSIEKE